MKKVYLIHGWDGNPENCWFPWLKRELIKRGFEVTIPSMPNSSYPKIKDWIEHLRKIIKNPDKDTYFIGHSIGCQAIMRYLQELPNKVKIGGIIFVAGWFNLPYLKTQEEKVIAGPWLNSPIDFNKIKSHVDNIITIFSDNDPDVPLSDKDLFESKLNTEVIIEHNKGHFSDDAGIFKLPIVLNKILEIAQ